MAQMAEITPAVVDNHSRNETSPDSFLAVLCGAVLAAGVVEEVCLVMSRVLMSTIVRRAPAMAVART